MQPGLADDRLQGRLSPSYVLPLIGFERPHQRSLRVEPALIHLDHEEVERPLLEVRLAALERLDAGERR